MHANKMLRTIALRTPAGAVVISPAIGSSFENEPETPKFSAALRPAGTILLIEAPCSPRTLPTQQMFPRPLILRRFVALSGIVLALVATLQESHALCVLASCTPGAPCDDNQAQQPRRACGCCGHRNNKSLPHTGSVPHEPIDDRDPCDPDSCHSQPCPRDVPRNIAQSVESHATSLVAAFLPNRQGTNSEVSAIQIPAAALRYSARSSGTLCALLCRFLT